MGHSHSWEVEYYDREKLQDYDFKTNKWSFLRRVAYFRNIARCMPGAKMVTEEKVINRSREAIPHSTPGKEFTNSSVENIWRFNIRTTLHIIIWHDFYKYDVIL